MRVNWREISAARNSHAALFAACSLYGYPLHPAREPLGDVTCYSLNSLNEPSYREEIREAPCTTIVGGPHATACPEEVARYADYVVVGEGEYTLPRLLTFIEEGKEGPLPGVVTAEAGLPVDHAVRLDAFPPFSVMKGYIEISRGCPFGCAFCQTPRIFGPCMRHRSIDAIGAYARRYRDVRLVSPNALAYGSDGRHPRPEKVERLLSSLHGNIYFGTFPNEVRPEFVDDRALDLIARYCSNTRVAFGIQSGSDRVLREIGRGHTVADGLRAVELSRDHGLVPVVDLILGFPFETPEDEEATLGLVRTVVRSGVVRLHAFLPLPGTPLAGTVPRPVSPEAGRFLGKLALSGKLTGTWTDPERRFSKHRGDTPL
ncbi:MAG TPA: TIGR04013 family B12-binding domain/radical SAM domain-containing protein [Methanomicrobiales archaeon]|jgi:B12-binding domain/radical SAM domain protein|nr:TIGR04013 family B12-binding domain/radical SAM domain-containing protein [Methanomicrobiales archaeon]